MKKEELEKFAAWFGAYVDGFRDGGGALPAPLEYKRAHSLRVAENAALIAAGLGLQGGAAGLARAAGLLHDAGRFTQYSRYATFRDSESLDHGQEGRRVLEEKAAGLCGDAGVLDRLLCAVQYHNRKAEDLPSGLPSGHDSLLRLVRDADKLDILGEMVNSVETDGFRGLHAMVPDIKLTLDLTPGVMEAVARGETLSLRDLFTLADIIVMAAAWFYDLNYGPARSLAAERGFLARLRRQLPQNPRTDAFFDGINRAAAGPGRHYLS